MKIWIVEGTTGEYSDCSDWTVCAYTFQEHAEEHVHKATWRAKEIQKAMGRLSRPPKGANEFDPEMQMDYTGTEYYTVETELREGVLLI